MMDALLDLTAQMAREGIRRLLVLSGDESWTLQQAQALRERLGGDGLWVGPRAGFRALRGARRAENAAGAGSDARLFRCPARV